MSPEEQRLLTDLFDRTRTAANTQRDRDAEDLIAQRLREQPYAAYFLAQAVIVQDQALQATTKHIQELEARLQELEAAQANQGRQGGFLGSLGSIFGGGNMAPRADARQGALYDDYRRNTQNEAPPAYASPWGRDGAANPGPWAQPASSSGGFLRGALTTAAGVAGGVLVADAVRDFFSPHMGGFASGLGGFGGGPIEETVVNNYIVDDGNSANFADDDDDMDVFDDSGDDDSYA
jgi:hypothetical protein